MTRPVRRTATLALTLLLLGGVACGGDDDDAGSERLSKAEFIKQGDGICAELNQESEKVNPEGENLAALAAFLDQIIPLIENASADFSALNPPKDASGVKTSMIKSLDAGVDASRDAKQAAEKNDETAVTEALKDIESAGEDIKDSTGKYGFKVCSQSS